MNDPELHKIVLDLIGRIEELERSLAAVVAKQRSLSLEATRLIAEMGAKFETPLAPYVYATATTEIAKQIEGE